MASDPFAVSDLISQIATWLHRLMPAGERRDALVAALVESFGDVDAPVTAEQCAAVERCAWAHSRHLALAFEPAGTAPPDTVAPGWPALDPVDVRARAASVSKVYRLDSTCVIKIDDLDPISLAQPFVDAAFTLARGATGIVLDLRDNGGGDTATLARIAGWLLGDEAIALSEVVYQDRRRQWWTPDWPTGTALRQPACVLVSARTFSSGEALAYHLQARRRVTVVGESTPGAADHITPIRLAPSVQAYLPEAYVVDTVTGTNWEGKGVVPDVPCPADDALASAVSMLRGTA